ncbi:hypothetical protein CF319_g6335 [Tilletia indica]|nr:hypothetical protein CF319_g6335 [Tilletia indica]
MDMFGFGCESRSDSTDVWSDSGHSTSDSEQARSETAGLSDSFTYSQVAAANFMLLSGSGQQVAQDRYPTLGSRRAIRGQTWEHMATILTRQLYQWFECQTNDYSSHDHKSVGWVELVWIGHGGDSPHDVSARPFIVEAASITDADRPVIANTGGVVYRHYYDCLGLCVHPLKDLNPDTKTKAAGMCAGNVKLLIEVDAKDLTKCHIYQKGRHPEAKNLDDLQYSRRLRLHMMDLGSRSGMTSAKLKQELLRGLASSADTGALPRRGPLPTFRLPTAAQIDRLMSSIRQANRLHSDPFVAVHQFTRLNTDNVFAYRPLSITKKEKRFSLGVKSSWSIQNLIMWQGRAMFMDSSWRNKNENRAPLTFVTTTNSAGHMVPAAAYLSADATADSYAHLLRNLEKEVVMEAARICAAPSDNANARLLKHAHEISQQRSWRPASVMIDKCRAEFNAIEEVWPGIQVRICQFHVMQAICRWDVDIKTASSSPPSIKRKDKPAICLAFRGAQRCRQISDWPATLEIFEANITKTLHEYESSVVAQVIAYFRVNWWSPPWHLLVTDIGLGAGQTRDGINTSNTIERAFKTFDEVFLSCRVNKRIDRLVHVLVCDWLVYYEAYSSTEPRLSAIDRDVMLEAHKLWECRAVQPSNKATIFTVLGLGTEQNEPKLYSVSLSASHLRCNCARWKQSGKLCAHMHAAKIFMAMGDVTGYHPGEHKGMPALRSPNEDLRSTEVSDAAVLLDVDAVLVALDESEAEGEVEPSSKKTKAGSTSLAAGVATSSLGAHESDGGVGGEGDTRMETERPSSGRPAAVKPLHSRTKPSSKSKSSSSLRLSSKPGPAKRPPWSASSKAPAASAPLSQTPSKAGASLPASTTDGKESGMDAIRPVYFGSARKDELEAQIAAMNDLNTVRVQVPPSPSFHLAKDDFTALRPGQWLTGSIISLFAQATLNAVQSKKRSVTAMGARRVMLPLHGLFQHPCSEREMAIRAESWYPNTVLLNQDQIVTPVNFSNSHWATVIINVNTRHIELVDSMPTLSTEARPQAVVRFFREFLTRRAAWEVDRGHTLDSEALKVDSWTFSSNSPSDTSRPVQQDGYSCGVVACRVIEAVLKGNEATWKNCGLRAQHMSEAEANATRCSLFQLIMRYSSSS